MLERPHRCVSWVERSETQQGSLCAQPSAVGFRCAQPNLRRFFLNKMADLPIQVSRKDRFFMYKADKIAAIRALHLDRKSHVVNRDQATRPFSDYVEDAPERETQPRHLRSPREHRRRDRRRRGGWVGGPHERRRGERRGPKRFRRPKTTQKRQIFGDVAGPFCALRIDTRL